MTTVVEAIDLFVATLRGRHAPPNTIKAYASDLRRFAGAVPADLVALDAATIRAFLDGNATSAATRRRRYAALCSFYRWLVRQDILDVNPMERVDRVATVSHLPRPLGADTVGRLLAAIPLAATRDRALFTLLYETGMRVGEALDLQVADIDLTPDDEKVRVLARETAAAIAARPRDDGRG